MNRISPKVAAIIAGIFALLLIAYVFAGGKGRSGNPDKLSDAEVAGVPRAGPATRCSSQKSSDLVKSELFRQAADMRGDDAGTFSNVASYAFLRIASPRLVGEGEDGGVVSCAGGVTLDLPPGLSVAGGRRSLGGDISFTVRPGEGGQDVVTVGNADAIITPLATLSRAGGSATSSTMRAPEQEPGPSGNAIAEPRTRQAEPAPAPRAAAPAPGPLAPARPAPAAPREPAPRTAPVATAPRAAASPSFNCRNARTSGEIAVCRDGGLASLDRQMAGQFYRALSAADAGKKAQLQRSRTRFLRFRDSCGSSACVAGAYRDRMREIDDIMNERWSPR